MKQPTATEDEMSIATQETIANLEYAKQRLIEYGWRRGNIGNKDEGFCLLGACMPEGWGVEPFTTYRALEMQISMDYPNPNFKEAPARWNDRQRDKRKVVRLINRTIKSIKEGKIKV